MHTARSLVLLSLAALLVSALAASSAPRRYRRQLQDDNTLQPVEGESSALGDEQTREKRKLEEATQAKYGIKNAVLGFVFGSGTTWNHHRQLDTQSQAALRSERSSSTSPTPVERQFGTRTGPRFTRQLPTTADGIPIFDRNKVSLDFPGTLFGPSVSLVIRTTKIIGDVIQNSAERYRTFLRLFRPLFRGPFEIKGLDPPPPTTTTTTTTTTSTTTAKTTTTSTTTNESTSKATDAVIDNEVRRRRRQSFLRL